MQLSPLLTRSLRLTTAATGLLLASCAGYHAGADKPGRLEHVQSIAVPTFRNLTLEPRSAVLVTNNVVRQFQIDGTYQIKDAQEADAVLKGTIKNFTRRQLRSARNNNLRTRELELVLWVEYTVEEPGSGSILAKGTINSSTSVFLDPNFQLSERQAIDDASRKLAEELVSRLSEGWGLSEFPEKSPTLKPAGHPKMSTSGSFLPEKMR